MNRLLKISTLVVGLIFGSTSAFAFIGELGLNIGISGVVTELDATGTESEGNVGTVETNKRSEKLFGAYGELFLEIQHNFITVGVSRAQTLESEETELTNDNSSGDSNTNKVKVDIADLTTVYLKLDLPMDVNGGNLYIRGGIVEADLLTKENLGTGSKYDDGTLEGYMGGIGYERDLDEVFIRAEANMTGFDPVSFISTNNTDNRIKVNSLDGVGIQLFVGKSF